jgi:putative methylase
VKRSELVRRLAMLEPFAAAEASLEQVGTPPELAAELLESALVRGDVEGRTVLDLGCGTGILAIGASLLNAAHVIGVEVDDAAVVVARRNAERLWANRLEFRVRDVTGWTEPAETVVMNPPFGAQSAHADRPFWEAALASATVAVYAFASRESRTFIERRAVARRARIEETRPVDWRFPATFPHHRKRAVELAVDLWILRPGPPS